MKKRLGAIGSHLLAEKSTAAQESTANSLTPTGKPGDACLQAVPGANVVGKAADVKPGSRVSGPCSGGSKAEAGEEESKDPRKLLQEFLEKFQHKANPMPTVAPKLRATYFTLETPPATPKSPLASPPGLGTT